MNDSNPLSDGYEMRFRARDFETSALPVGLEGVLVVQHAERVDLEWCPLLEASFREYRVGHSPHYGMKIAASVAEAQLLVALASDAMRHTAMIPAPGNRRTRVDWEGGAFLDVNWETASSKVFDSSIGLGPLPETMIAPITTIVNHIVALYRRSSLPVIGDTSCPFHEVLKALHAFPPLID